MAETERRQCSSTTYKAERCKLSAQAGVDHCAVHDPSKRRGPMTPGEALAYIRANHMEAVRAVVAAAPPPPADAVEMMRALGFPLRPRTPDPRVPPSSGDPNGRSDQARAVA